MPGGVGGAASRDVPLSRSISTMTFIAALRHDQISAPWVIDVPINGKLFTLYVEKVLAPTLAKGEVVILDNLSSHKGKPARDAIRAKGAHLLFQPPCSPDLNPIEPVFAKLIHLIRAAEPRDVEATWRKIGELLDLRAREFAKEKRGTPGWRCSAATPVRPSGRRRRTAFSRTIFFHSLSACDCRGRTSL
ncbi:transposase [Bradyrhizobium sp. USDA 10063]